MARVVSEHDLASLDSESTLWAYNALDCTGTAEIAGELRKQLDNTTTHIYEFEKACMAWALDMDLRGIRVDMLRRDGTIKFLQGQGATLDSLLAEYGQALGHITINPNSPQQLKKIFYDQLGFPRQTKYDKKDKEEKLSTDRDALEKLSKLPLANPLCKAILARRDVGKKVSVLRSGIDPDGRMRFNFNIGGTETGRLSSSKSAFGGGMNAQNITEEIRSIFIASPGKKLAYIDLEQAESRAVAFISGDKAYTAATESGDLHTTVARLIWPNLTWTGDLVQDRRIADQPFYRQFSYRDMSKRGGHGSNYLGTARTMALHLKVEEELIRDFQRNYFDAFPGIPAWHQSTATELQTFGCLTTPFGRRRHFLGRLRDSSTIREAVAFVPQSLIADYMNTGVCRLWSWNKVDLLAQVHDAVLFEYPDGQDELAFEAARILSRPITLQDGRQFSVPCDIAVGWNWGKANDNNPDGLKKLKAGKPDLRSRQWSEDIFERRLTA